MELKPADIERIRKAYHVAAAEQRVSDNWSPHSIKQAKQHAHAAEKLAKVWHDMTEDERATVRSELAFISGAPADELDVGLAAQKVAMAAKGKPGIKVRDNAFNSAVSEAVRVWQDNGNAITQVNHWRDRDDERAPRPFLAFVADAIEAALPPEAISRATGMKTPDRDKILQTIEARLRA